MVKGGERMKSKESCSNPGEHITKLYSPKEVMEKCCDNCPMRKLFKPDGTVKSTEAIDGLTYRSNYDPETRGKYPYTVSCKGLRSAPVESRIGGNYPTLEIV